MMLKLAQIAKAYGSSCVLSGVTLSCERGEAVCLAGANAVGKTTLLTIAAGLNKPDGGEIVSDGRIGFVPQEVAFMEELNVRDNLRLWYAAHKRPRKELFASGSYEVRLGLLAHARKRCGKLSGGIRRRTAIACTLTGLPDYLLLDEPFVALDLQSRTDIFHLLKELLTQDKGILFTSHDPNAIAQIAHRVLLLQEGQIVQEMVLEGDLSQRTEQVMYLFSKGSA